MVGYVGGDTEIWNPQVLDVALAKHAFDARIECTAAENRRVVVGEVEQLRPE